MGTQIKNNKKGFQPMPYKLPVTSTPGLSNYVQEPQTKVFATQAEPIEPFANEPQDHPQDCSG